MNKKSFRFPYVAVFCLLFVCCAFSTVCLGQGPDRNTPDEAAILSQLEKADPSAVPTFKQATAALDSAAYAEAIGLYRTVLGKNPNFTPAMRRLGYALAASGNRQEGLAMTKKALDLDRSHDNLMGHVYTLMGGRGGDFSQIPKGDLTQAFVLANEGVKMNPNDADALFALAELSLSLDKIEDFNRASAMLDVGFPDEVATQYYGAIRLANAGDLDGAETRIQKAVAMGLPQETSKPFLDAIQAERDSAFFGLWKYYKYGMYLLSAWAIGLVGLFIAGKVLSKKTLQSIESSHPNDITGRAQDGLKSIYRRVITAAGIYYYVSQPFVILLVLLVTSGVILFFVSLGTIPIKLVAILAIVGLAAIFFLLKSLIIRPKVEDPGRRLSEREAPGLWQLIRDVAGTLDTRPVDEIRITHGSDLAVYERGGFREKMSNNAERVLILGTATLNGFSQNAFRSVLAHEYGHFSNRDTAGGDIAFNVNSDIMRSADGMVVSGTATHYNIAFQFLRVYHYLFRRITHGASRLQEILADRVAVYQYGAEAFREGLSHVIRRGVEFNHLAEREINAAMGASRAMQNLYEMSVHDESVKDVEQQINEVVSRATTDDDTHPSPSDRFRMAERIKTKSREPLEGMMWELFADREGLTIEMNKLIERLVRENG